LDHTDTALLISRSREGDAAAVETLVHTYREPIFRLAISLLDDPAEADEATQDAFVAAIDRLHTFRGEASFTTWLYAIALNVCRGRLRKRRGRERLLGVLQSLFRAERDSVEPP
jgi:RNA polymerase sigma-70 factor (ECF subfamily)